MLITIRRSTIFSSDLWIYLRSFITILRFEPKLLISNVTRKQVCVKNLVNTSIYKIYNTFLEFKYLLTVLFLNSTEIRTKISYSQTSQREEVCVKNSLHALVYKVCYFYLQYINLQYFYFKYREIRTKAPTLKITRRTSLRKELT